MMVHCGKSAKSDDTGCEIIPETVPGNCRARVIIHRV